MKKETPNRFIVIVPGDSTKVGYSPGNFKTDAEANQFIGKRALAGFGAYVIDKDIYPGQR